MSKADVVIKIFVYLIIFSCSGAGYFLLAQKLAPKPDPIAFAQEMLINQNGHIKRALFTPDEDIKHVLIGLINAEKKSICVAIFMFTEPEITQALIDAHNRGVLLEVVADRSCAQTQWSKLQLLAQVGVPIYIWPQALEATRAIMHNKFVIFSSTLDDRTLLWTGSYNFTKAASLSNQENALIIEDDDLALTYLAQFEHLKEVSELVGANKLPVPDKKRKNRSNKPHEMAFVQA